LVATVRAMPRHCRAASCRFASTHVLAAHRCGRCKALGHGMVECLAGCADEVWEAGQHDRMPVDDWCTVAGCDARSTHATSAHVCGACGTLGHECLMLACPICRVVGVVQMDVFADSECAVCYEKKPVVVLDKCKHAVVCRACATQIART